uniref:efflux RND transporter permease subunit n=1 Tax=Hydrocarboniphaga effusa TaxID=243629 RepID=UPI00398C06D8
MKTTRFSASNPAATAAAALIVLLFGLLSLARLPVQLLPDTKNPQIWISVNWREAAPSEVEEALVEPIEEAMRG